MGKGILLRDGDVEIHAGTVVIGDTAMQDAFIVLGMNQGELKDDPLAGVNLVRMIRGKTGNEKMRKTIEVGLGRIGIKFDDIKDKVGITIKTE